ncbi:MAG TPA: hypothetical protein ENJ45_03930 [Phaeodactylibacter sp.]|nr:hypothetical protein [Phaeodactylibacter sp.]
MRHFLFYAFIISIAFACHPKPVDNTLTPAPAPPPPLPLDNSTELKDSLPFPQSWVGKWKGDLNIWQGTKIVRTIPMNMVIAPTDSTGQYHWTTTFGDKADTEKPYTLKTVDAEKGHYIIDEHNSIIIESYLFDNRLVSWYTVMGSLILASFEKKEEEIEFLILAGSEKPVSTTGGTKIDEEDIPEVKTMPFNVMQKAVLRPVE